MNLGRSSIFRIVAELDCPLCLVHRSGVIRVANAALARLVGRTAAALAGTSLQVLLPAAEAATLQGQLAQPELAHPPVSSTLHGGKAMHRAVLLRVLPASEAQNGLVLVAVTPIDGDRGGEDIGRAFDQDITEAKRTEEALQQTLRELDAIMRNAPVAIVFTRDRRIVRYNPKFAEMFGFDGDAGVGMSARVLYRSDEEYDALGRIAAPLLSSGKPFHTELFMRRQDGIDFWVNLIGYVQNIENTREGTIWIAEDRTAHKRSEEALRQAHAELEHRVEERTAELANAVTALSAEIVERRRAEAELKRHRDHLDELVRERTAELIVAKERAEVASKSKSVFLASMSHELRTPLNAVLGYAQVLLCDKGLSERQAVGLHTIEHSGEHLLMLINDILDLAKIEAGKLELYPSVINLPAFLRVIDDIVRVKAEQNGLLFVFESSPDLPRAVRSDDKRLRQILLNLLSNAVKFTDRGQVTLRVCRLSSRDAQVHVRFEVEDTGTGISELQSEIIFKPFEQVGDVRRRAGGTGLGLAISRQLVQLMGSDIHVESRLGEGSRFWFDLDLPVEEFADGAEPSQRSITGYQGSRKKVLVVDDVAGNRAVVTALLSSLGFETFEAMNGEALAQAAAHEPDLIILDVVMPVMDGVEATRRLRQAPALEDVPIIAVSASASGPDPSLSVAAGANAFLPKPLDFDRLLQQTGTLLQLTWTYELPQEARQAVAAIHAFVAPPPEELDKLYKLAMTGNMREIREWATQVAMLDERYRPFADHLHRLAEAFQSKAILALVGEYRAGGRA